MARPDDRSPAEDDPDDDAALSWEGDEQFGRATSLTEPRAAATRAGAVGSADADDLATAPERGDPTDPPTAPPASVASRLVTVLGGVAYLAWTVGWILGVQQLGDVIAPATGVGFVDFVARIAQFMALVSAPLWFAATLQLTRASALRFRIGWLAVGLGVLVPWPFVIGALA